MKEYKYGCGHKSDTIIMNNSIMALATYFEWKDSVGFDGDKSQCFGCYCDELKDEIQRKD